MVGTFASVVREVTGDRELPADLEGRLVAQLATARAAWPTVDVEPVTFVRALATRLPADEPVATALARIHASDLYLACGCVAGLAPAIAAFEAHVGPTIARVVASAGASPSEAADLAQVVRERLLVAPTGAPPRLATYNAAGALTSWVRIVATREAARLLPRARREAVGDDEELARLIAPDDDPALGYVKARYRTEFKRAFQAAVAALDDRQRLVLRQHVLDGLGIDQLAALHAVHRATAARWIDGARRAILEATSADLASRLALSPAELEGMLSLIRSQLDMSLSRILG